jgi:hypothetical protein
MADAQLQIVIDAVDNASKDLNNLKKQLKGITAETDKTTKATGNLADGFKSFLSTAGMVAAGVTAGYFALKKFYDIAKQGAELQFVEDRFNRLAESVGTTADVLLGDLRTATKGLRSDSELMASATDFMALGFAKTADEAVRLATVAGALNMNMNQLVLTLANQTTMRFDQLGVAVEGFDERLKALKASGMDANAAFQEAFLQQAEAQIGKVGNAADASIGDFMKMEAAFKNLGDAIKNDFAQSVEGVIPLMTQLAVGMVETQRRGVEYRDVMTQLDSAMKGGVISGAEYSRMLTEMGVHSNAGSVSAAALQKALKFLDGAYQGYAGTVDMTAENTIALAIAEAQMKNALEQIPEAAGAAGDATLQFAVSSEKAALAVDNFLEKAGIFKDDFAEMFDLSKQMTNMIGYVTNYDDIMDQIAAKEAERADLIAKGWSENGRKVREVTKDIEELQVALENLPKDLTLDLFFQAIQANGKVTRDEFKAYMDMGVAYGKWSQEAADKSMAEWDHVMETVNDWEIDPKTGDVHMKLDTEEVDNYQPKTKKGLVEWLINHTRVDDWQPPDKHGRVIYSPSNASGTVAEFGEAIGGPVYAQAAGGMTLPHYWVGELGPEPFFPETNGRIVSNTQALSALRSGAEGGGSSQPIVVNINTPVNLADRVWVERELAPYIRKELQKAGK